MLSLRIIFRKNLNNSLFLLRQHEEVLFLSLTVTKCFYFIIFKHFLKISLPLCPNTGQRLLTYTAYGLHQNSPLYMHPSHPAISLLIYLVVAGCSPASTEWLCQTICVSTCDKRFLSSSILDLHISVSYACFRAHHGVPDYIYPLYTLYVALHRYLSLDFWFSDLMLFHGKRGPYVSWTVALPGIFDLLILLITERDYVAQVNIVVNILRYLPIYSVTLHFVLLILS